MLKRHTCNESHAGSTEDIMLVHGLDWGSGRGSGLKGLWLVVFGSRLLAGSKGRVTTDELCVCLRACVCLCVRA